VVNLHDEPDGRRRRALHSRARIVAAMFALIQGGDLSPSAEAVAAKAGVGLRTVFRHFADMERLYLEMTAMMEEELRSVANQPFVGRTWRERVMELIPRRGAAFEAIAPFRRAADARRHASVVLQEVHDRLAAALRQILRAQVPNSLANDAPRFEALDLLLSFEAWDRLRRDQHLSPAATRQALERAVKALIDAS
jgi:AcrR family transcriptional regulator